MIRGRWCSELSNRGEGGELQRRGEVRLQEGAKDRHRQSLRAGPRGEVRDGSTRGLRKGPRVREEVFRRRPGGEVQGCPGGAMPPVGARGLRASHQAKVRVNASSGASQVKSPPQDQRHAQAFLNA